MKKIILGSGITGLTTIGWIVGITLITNGLYELKH